MSTTTGFWKRWRYSVATLAAKTTASGSSPFTWKIGASTILATSDGYGEEREKRGSVVKPIWLLMMKWTEPPVRWPRRPERPRHSATTPWPAKRSEEHTSEL